MKIEKFNEITPSGELRTLLQDSQPSCSSIRKRDILKTLFKPENQRYVPIVVVCLKQSITHKTTCEKLLRAISTRLLIQRETSLEQIQSSVHYDQFPE